MSDSASGRPALAVELRHLRRGVARARGPPAGRVLDAGHVAGAQLHVQCAERLVQPLASARADERHDAFAAREPQPTATWATLAPCSCATASQALDKREVALEVIALKRGDMPRKSRGSRARGGLQWPLSGPRESSDTRSAGR